MSSDIMRYVGGAVPTERRVPQVNLLLDMTAAPTSAISRPCEWSGYDMILVEAMFYSNVMASIMVPVDYFAATTSSHRVLISDTYTSQMFDVYQNGGDSVFVKANSSVSNTGVRIYGVLFGE